MRFLALSALIACAPVPAELAPDIAPDGRPLREVAAPHDRRIGTFLWFATTPDAAFQRALAELDMYIVPVFFRQVQPERGTWDFTLADGVADAAPPGTVLYVPGLITNDLIPDWLASG
ncbi:MAG TPA: hypothetical protein VMZ53_28640, partial [Kofleriaceae bacterium]|nr:hypothetical protein [Kofleriaceae bacterium]